MIKYEVFRTRKQAIWLEVEHGNAWGSIVQEDKLPGSAWDRHSIRVPIDGLRNAVAKVTIKHEVG